MVNSFSELSVFIAEKGLVSTPNKSEKREGLLMFELDGKQKLVAIEIVKELKERLCEDCQEGLDKFILELVYS